MAALAALGLAAAIVQFVEFATKVTQRLADFSAATEDIPRAFRQIKIELPLIVDGVNRIKEQSESGKSGSGTSTIEKSTQEALLPVIRQCQAEMARLNEILEKTVPAAGASTWERRRKALASLANDKKVEQIAEALGKYVQTLMFHQVIENVTLLNLRAAVPVPAAAEQPGPVKKKVFWVVPFDRNPSFVGRERVFAEIESTFRVKEGSQPKAAIHGLGGIGKSQIALELCYRTRQTHPDRSIFWINAATVARFEESFKRIASSCDLASRGDKADTDSASLVQTWLETRHEGDWLMVIDNVDDGPAFFEETMRNGKTAAECIPRGTHRGCLLFTTRTNDIAFDLATPASPIIIDEMTREEGLELVRARLPLKKSTTADAEEEKIIVELLAELEYIPLAITQAVAFIAKRKKTIQQYLQQYRTDDDARTKLLSFEFTDHGRQGSARDSVAKTWAISFQSIRDSNKRAAEMLCQVSFLQHQGIPASLLRRPEEDEFDFDDAVALLKAFSFIDDVDESTDTAPSSLFSTHRLVQLATRWWLEKQGAAEEDGCAFEALQSIARQFPAPNSNLSSLYLKSCEMLQPHAELLLRHKFKARSPTKDMEVEQARLLAHTGRYIQFLGAASESRAHFERSLAIRRRLLGERHIDTLRSMGLLFWILAVHEHDTGSIPMGWRLLDLRRAVLGDDHPDTIDGMSDLADVIRASGDLNQSEVLQREALARSERVLGRHHHDTLNCMAHLAHVLEDQQRYREAARYQREVYVARLNMFGPEHPTALTEECNLAVILWNRFQTRDEALEMIKRNMETKTKVHGVDHVETLVSVFNYGLQLNASGRSLEAVQLYTDVLEEASEGPRKNNSYSQMLIHRIEQVRASWMQRK